MNISDITRVTSAQAYAPPVARPEKPAGENTRQAVAPPLVRSDSAGAPSGASNRVSENQSAPLNPAQDARAEDQASQTSRDALQSALDKIEKFISVAASDINFSIDEESGVTVIKIIDRGTKDVIRQIPTEEMLDISRALDRLQGLFIKNKA
ncbi:MAG: flagellar protein FlaG [Candidatus Accumulibacter sp.]|jgi:flagellar protein FlaG|nr:flagellar protein FlaG [Accumulibacter sp.]